MCAKTHTTYLYISVYHLLLYTATVVVLCGREHGVYFLVPVCECSWPQL